MLHCLRERLWKCEINIAVPIVDPPFSQLVASQVRTFMRIEVHRSTWGGQAGSSYGLGYQVVRCYIVSSADGWGSKNVWSFKVGCFFLLPKETFHVFR